ncbi:glycogen-debranching protein [Bradyrhizobium sp. Ec3.3]|uniref:glycogen debranching protein n=1 Tax=Bradyrhizobium sp. Ec3.3 TaxID=189753 RepID=UPI000414919D|nr:isoamylase [Bradyrhizobium sp. Ec3.3]
MADLEGSEGLPWPLGCSRNEADQSCNFALYSKHATAVTLLLYRDGEFATPLRVLPFTFPVNKSGRVWHMRLPSEMIADAKYYAYQVDGPFDPVSGQRFDRDKILLDPYAKGVFFPPAFSRDAAMEAGSNAGKAPLGLLADGATAPPPGRPPAPRHDHELIIYEMHVRGFTRRANSKVPEDQRGTFAGIVAKIPYLKNLGVTAVELMPVHQFEPGTTNYWGYMTLNFFSPHAPYSVAGRPENALGEFRLMVDELHRAGIEVLLDVVYNHTAEMGNGGPTYSFRGIDNSTYYALSPTDFSSYVNFSGCGNDLRTAHPAPRLMVVDSLRYWATSIGVDGFRFDLASIFARNEDGSLNSDDPPIVVEISSDHDLADIRLIAEPWDAGGGYQMGRAFPGRSWCQWNDHFRSTVRGFVKGDGGLVADLMTRLYGSTDLLPDTLADADRRTQSINFVDCHDGLNLCDLVSYTNDDQRSWGCGYEGTNNVPPDVAALRKRQVKNFCCLLMLSNGVPMFVAGDEFMHSQNGNPNVYDQDNEITWLDWDLAETNADVLRFFRMMIGFRKAHSVIARSTGWGADCSWHGTDGNPELGGGSRSLALHLSGASTGGADIFAMFNAYWEALSFELPTSSIWKRVVDTSLESPNDIVEEAVAQPYISNAYSVGPRSVAVLISSKAA